MTSPQVLQPCGAFESPSAGIQWRLWAPRLASVDLVLLINDQRIISPMHKEVGGYFFAIHTDVPEDVRYGFRLRGNQDRPDPCSRWQPHGLPGPSALYFPTRFPWTDAAWKGIPRRDLVFYELHVGTFTPEGTFDAIIPRLGTLKDLGITALELMPVAQFSGERNWGYDGVLPFAVQNSYGGPAGLQRLVNAAHQQGLAVFLDVVYNHFGPEHNHLEEFAPYLTDRHTTPWGKAINFDGEQCQCVRSFILENVRMWLEDYHLDGLRLDAVHAIVDTSRPHILQQIKDIANHVAARTGRALHIVAESEARDPKIILPMSAGGYGLDAKWHDDFHHALHALLTGERRGYYAPYGELWQLARALQASFSDADPSADQDQLASLIDGDQLIFCTQNHDQVGNRAKGDRLRALVTTDAKLRLAACFLLLSPCLPLLFMGEEYGETHSFPFFCSFTGEVLHHSVREGRRREFANFVDDLREIPDPNAPETFRSAKLSWSWPPGSRQSALRLVYKDLLALRRRVAVLRDFQNCKAQLLPEATTGPLLMLQRGLPATDQATALFNICPETIPIHPEPAASLLFASESPRYGGPRTALHDYHHLLPFECVLYSHHP